MILFLDFVCCQIICFFCASVVLGFADDDILLNHRTFTSIKYMNNFHSESVQLKYDE